MLKREQTRKIESLYLIVGSAFSFARLYSYYKYYGWEVLLVVPVIFLVVNWMLGRMTKTSFYDFSDIDKIVHDQKHWKKE